ncbi:Scm4p KNAG_0D04030 [Huiozyma naganishii CBS 8797]|uniref:Autophagy-related protein 33 n=1 Tax=Huiozyma naganishii (strain ATCC MYA-139 / BCRC 22969 / CBS 8797 / KCTC 17520 / NBRC 10181 / NCYC 3082 / Yp74L-3) TaxID=1071383 RepID=J7S619_HUIN7|nr:hypothetical protein KNAG_0D04030 [Kazachstania naganishii CBS 8797]CCK70149.1 hypothetical protein KNAG_0D04030 [Kazachstania naganishii CBS 8797]
MPLTASNIYKGIAISSLGLYAGLVSTTTAVKVLAPANVSKNSLGHTYCIIAIGGTIIGLTATATFGVSYYLSPSKDASLLFSLAVVPVTGLYLWASNKIVSCFFAVGSESRRPEPESTGKNVELPPNHPSVYGENGEKLKCPFGNGADSAAKRPTLSGKILAWQGCQKILSSMNPHLVVASTAGIIGFSKAVFQSM